MVTRKKPKKDTETDIRSKNWSKKQWGEVHSVLDGVDAVANEMERKWGVGRLRLLVSDDLRIRFDEQARLWNVSLWEGATAAEAIHHGQAMKRGWIALDQWAENNDCRPLAPVVWEVGLADGTLAAITRTSAEASAVVRENRAIRVYTLEEIGRLLAAIPNVAQVKDYFPGAKITAVRPELPPVDEFPDIFTA
jgi:hypothetical protein